MSILKLVSFIRPKLLLVIFTVNIMDKKVKSYRYKLFICKEPYRYKVLYQKATYRYKGLYRKATYGYEGLYRITTF